MVLSKEEEEEEEEEEGSSSGGDFSDEDKSGSAITTLNEMNFFLIQAKTQRH